MSAPLPSPIDWTTVENTLFTWVKNVLGLSVYVGQQNVPERPMPYITMDRLNGPVGDRYFQQSTYNQSTNDLTVITEGPREFTVTFKASVSRNASANDDAVALLNRLSDSHAMIATQALMEANAIALVQCNPTLDISLVVNGEYISRASLDVRFRTGSRVVERVNNFESVHITSSEPADVDKEIES